MNSKQVLNAVLLSALLSLVPQAASSEQQGTSQASGLKDFANSLRGLSDALNNKVAAPATQAPANKQSSDLRSGAPNTDQRAETKASTSGGFSGGKKDFSVTVVSKTAYKKGTLLDDGGSVYAIEAPQATPCIYVLKVERSPGSNIRDYTFNIFAKRKSEGGYTAALGGGNYSLQAPINYPDGKTQFRSDHSSTGSLNLTKFNSNPSQVLYLLDWCELDSAWLGEQFWVVYNDGKAANNLNASRTSDSLVSVNFDALVRNPSTKPAEALNRTSKSNVVDGSPQKASASGVTATADFHYELACKGGKGSHGWPIVYVDCKNRGAVLAILEATANDLQTKGITRRRSPMLAKADVQYCSHQFSSLNTDSTKGGGWFEDLGVRALEICTEGLHRADQTLEQEKKGQYY